MVQSLFKKPHPDLDMAKLASDSQQTPTNTDVAMLVADIFGADRRPALEKFGKPALVIASGESRLLEEQKEMQKTMVPYEACGCAGHQPRRLRGRARNVRCSAPNLS